MSMLQFNKGIDGNLVYINHTLITVVEPFMTSDDWSKTRLQLLGGGEMIVTQPLQDVLDSIYKANNRIDFDD
jgi:uncharacterized protein YlzI (FlbEa/FlbD family)